MAEISIKGNKKYIKRLSKHLVKEHPSVKKKIKVKGIKKSN